MSLRLIVLTFLLGSCTSISNANEPITFSLKFDKEIFPESYSGRVYLFFGEEGAEPRTGPDWFHPAPFIAMDVENWKPDETLQLNSSDPHLLKFPKNFDEITLDEMVAQAVVRFNPYERNIGTGIGNGYSQPIPIAAGQSKLDLTITELVSVTEVPSIGKSEVVTIQSKLLSDFHHRPVFLNATVTFPEDYLQQPDKRFPVIYEVPGFGGTHVDPRQLKRHHRPRLNESGVEFIKVLLDPSCPRGHHVFANSENNGPYGDALIEELIPEIDRRFRTDAREYGRFLTGHSSGGWSSLWLQVNYPTTFGGTWSTSPDPVDFRDFQRINLYDSSSNMYVDPEGENRPLARMNGEVLLWYDDFCHMEDVLGYGGQLHSFEAVFSQKGNDGRPRSLWNRQTGEIDHEVAKSWNKYDINLILKNHWEGLKADLSGKLHVIMGDQDTFYLEGATILLKETLADLQSDAAITILPGRNHFDLFADGLSKQIEEEIAQQYLEHRNLQQSNE